MKTINPITLEDINSHLLERLNTLIDEEDTPEGFLKITEAVAKLNSSYRNNGQFTVPESADERAERESREALAKAINGK